jgi:hypothetical protein
MVREMLEIESVENCELPISVLHDGSPKRVLGLIPLATDYQREDQCVILLNGSRG